MKENFDIIIIGAGHAGCEAAIAASKLGCSVLLLCSNLDSVAYLACNPSIGGTAKGQIVKEIDALGGIMGQVADSSLLQIRMLNKGKGAAVYSPRAQVDKHKYHSVMKSIIENTVNLTLRQAEAVEIKGQFGEFNIFTRLGQRYTSKAVIIAAGVYLKSSIIIGDNCYSGGPSGFNSCDYLSDSIKRFGHNLRRFKTGTPARINGRSINFDKLQVQKGDNMPLFSYLNDDIYISVKDCYLTYSTLQTKQVVLDNIKRSPIFNGEIKGVGPRYCPSIEDKIVRFADKDRHQIFLEPEGGDTNEYYVQGVSSSMPVDVQAKIYSSITGLENVEIMRDAYAIEYDCIDSTQLYATLMSKFNKGLFFAGQINGTSGYEEAAAQGLVAGINAVKCINEQPYVVFERNNSYIGVLIDDITIKGTNEPYRMMTSRAEHRLYLRQDNADTRLTELGRQIGLVDDIRYNKYLLKKQQIEQLDSMLDKVIPSVKLQEMFDTLNEQLPPNGLSVRSMLRRTNIDFEQIQKYLNLFSEFSLSVKEQVEINIKYEGYINKQLKHIKEFNTLEAKQLPPAFDYNSIKGLSKESREKLTKYKPLNIGQASRISGVSPADIQVLLLVYNTINNE